MSIVHRSVCVGDFVVVMKIALVILVGELLLTALGKSFLPSFAFYETRIIMSEGVNKSPFDFF